MRLPRGVIYPRHMPCSATLPLIATVVLLLDASLLPPRQVLGRLRESVGSDSTVLGFIGLPFTIATYLVEGKSSSEYLEIKKMAHSQPKV